MAVGSDGGVYFIGSDEVVQEGLNARSYDIWLSKYDSNGNSILTRRVGNTDEQLSDSGYAVDGGANETLYVGGVFYKVGFQSDFWLRKYKD